MNQLRVYLEKTTTTTKKENKRKKKTPLQEISNFWHHKAIFYLCDSSSLFLLCKFSMLLLFTPGVPGESGVGLVPGEGLAVGRDGAARTRSLASCQLPRRRRCRVTAGTARGFLEQPLFLPPRRSVSMTRSNFGTRSGSAWAGPHSTPGPVVFRISLRRE